MRSLFFTSFYLYNIVRSIIYRHSCLMPTEEIEQTIRSKKILSFLARFFRYDTRDYIIPIDFGKSIFLPLFYKPIYAFLNILISLINSLESTLLPILISFVISNGNPISILWLGGCYLLDRVIKLTLFYYHPLYFIPLARSIEQHAYAKLIIVDPISHSTRSSGQIISKISRGVGSYFSFIEVIFYSLLPVVISTVLIIVVVSIFNVWLGIAFACIAVGLSYINYLMFNWRSKTINKLRIKFEDQTKVITIESMQQAPFLRSIFATNESIIKSDRAYKNFKIADMTGWRLSGYFISVTVIVGYIFTCLLLYYLIVTNTDKVIAAGIAFSVQSYFSNLQRIGKIIDNFTKNIDDIRDLFTFIHTYGQTTYPTIEHPTNTADTI